MAPAPQSFENHTRYVPGYHYAGALLLLVAVGYFGFRTATDFTLDRLMFLVVLVCIAILAYYTRAFALGVQDRVIRLEERLRMERLFPEELRPRIGEFTTAQLVALRFASDGELVELARRVLEEGVTDGRTIKAAIQEWRADYQRI